MKIQSRDRLLKLAYLSLCALSVLTAGCRMSMEAGHHLEDRNAPAYDRLRQD